VRDVVLVGGYKLLEPKGYELDVNLLGKGATLVLYSALALTLATSEGTDWPLWIFWVGLGLAVAAGVQYLVEARRKVGISR
jgi:phosphatidylglycerophosphate synthase